METVTDFIFLGSKITAYGDCSYEINRHLLLGRKAMTNLGSILKSRDVTLPTKVHLVKVMVFPVVVYGCVSWTVKKAERWRIDAFELWRRPLRVPWTARISNQSILKEISPEYSLEELMLKLKLQNFGHLMRRTDSLEKTLMLGKIWRWEKGTIEVEMFGWLHQFDGHEFEQAPGVGWWTGKPGVLQSMGLQRVRRDCVTELIWTFFQGLPWWLSGKESACNAGDAGSVPELGRSPGGGHDNHSSTLAWRIPWTEEPGRLQCIVLHRVKHDWSD